MEEGIRAVTVVDAITLLIALAALGVASLSLYLQRRDRLPKLRVSTDDRLPEIGRFIYSVRVVNEGSVPAQVRSVRLFLEQRRRKFRWGLPPWRVIEGRSILFPSVEDSEEDISTNLWPNEKSTAKDLPYMLQQGQSVRFATERYTVSKMLGSAGLHGEGGSEDVKVWVGIVDALDRVHAVEDEVYVDPPEPEP